MPAREYGGLEDQHDWFPVWGCSPDSIRARFRGVGTLFDDAGALGEAYRAVDWAATPLGPVQSWNSTLKAALNLTLNSRFPITLLWGPEFVMLYNEAYVQLITEKHPAALGHPAQEVFPEIWDVVGPMLRAVAESQGSTLMQDLRLDLFRNGFLEECYFTFAYSAVRGESGQVEGVIDITEETTPRILTRRRLEALSRLVYLLSDVADIDALPHRVVEALKAAEADLHDVRIATAESGPGELGLTFTHTAEGRVARLRLSVARLRHESLVLTARLSPALPLDEAYVTFLRLIGSTITEAVGRIQAQQSEREMAAMERQMSATLQLSLLTPPVVDERLEIAVRYRPASETAFIGGDWYDSFRVPGGRLTVAIGDVTGHDRHAAAQMAQIRNLLRGIAYTVKHPPSAILATLDSALASLGPSTMATVLLAQLEPAPDSSACALWWSNAGHLPPALLTADGSARMLESPAEPLVGFITSASRCDHRLELAPGDSVVFFTDGLIERRDPAQILSFEPLLRLLAGRRAMTAEDLCDLIVGHYGGGNVEDDVAVTVVRVHARG